MPRLLALLCLLVVPAVAIADTSQPNVILLMTDDQGYGELSCHGNPVLETLNLDRLHSQSARFTDFHVAPMCTPTRGQLLTGLDAARNGAINVSSGRTLLRAELPTMASLLRDGGYRTGIFGKWHLGDNYPYRPQDRGFEQTLWFPSSHISSTPDFWDNDYFNDTFRRNGQLQEYPGYCTDVFFDEAIEWMRGRADSDEPFFCYLPTNTPHWPHWVPDEERQIITNAWTKARENGSVRELAAGQRDELISYLAMILNIDENVGKLEQFLEDADLVEDTIFVFLTDNGSTFGPTYYNAGMRGRKTQLWEGGHRVPCFVRWPGGDVEPRDIEGVTQVQDLLPTLLDLCGLKSSNSFDGKSLAQVVRGQAAVPEDRMLVINYSRMPIGFEFAAPDSPSRMRREGAAVLWKNWRLLRGRELYDLNEDPQQQTNIIDQQPEVAEKMRKHLRDWWQDVRALANEAQPVIIGHPAENPMKLTACEWLDVFIDQQRQIRRADLKNGWWEVSVAEAGEYQFELRRWPRETKLALSAGLPASQVTDGNLPAGESLPIAHARMRIGTGPMLRKRAEPDAESVTFTTQLEAGRTRLYTWFEDAARQPIVGAYYIYVARK